MSHPRLSSSALASHLEGWAQEDLQVFFKGAREIHPKNKDATLSQLATLLPKTKVQVDTLYEGVAEVAERILGINRLQSTAYRRASLQALWRVIQLRPVNSLTLKDWQAADFEQRVAEVFESICAGSYAVHPAPALKAASESNSAVSELDSEGRLPKRQKRYQKSLQASSAIGATSHSMSEQPVLSSLERQALNSRGRGSHKPRLASPGESAADCSGSAVAMGSRGGCTGGKGGGEPDLPAGQPLSQQTASARRHITPTHCPALDNIAAEQACLSATLTPHPSARGQGVFTQGSERGSACNFPVAAGSPVTQGPVAKYSSRYSTPCHSGQQAHRSRLPASTGRGPASSEKLVLMLSPRDEEARAWGRSGGQGVENWELTMPSHKRVSSLLRHLQGKYGAAVPQGLALHLFRAVSAQEQLGEACQWGGPSLPEALTVGDIARVLGEPFPFCLHYAWLTDVPSPQQGSFAAANTAQLLPASSARTPTAIPTPHQAPRAEDSPWQLQTQQSAAQVQAGTAEPGWRGKESSEGLLELEKSQSAKFLPTASVGRQQEDGVQEGWELKSFSRDSTGREAAIQNEQPAGSAAAQSGCVIAGDAAKQSKDTRGQPVGGVVSQQEVGAAEGQLEFATSTVQGAPLLGKPQSLLSLLLSLSSPRALQQQHGRQFTLQHAASQSGTLRSFPGQLAVPAAVGTSPFVQQVVQPLSHSKSSANSAARLAQQATPTLPFRFPCSAAQGSAVSSPCDAVRIKFPRAYSFPHCASSAGLLAGAPRGLLSRGLAPAALHKENRGLQVQQASNIQPATEVDDTCDQFGVWKAVLGQKKGPKQGSQLGRAQEARASSGAIASQQQGAPSVPFTNPKGRASSQVGQLAPKKPKAPSKESRSKAERKTSRAKKGEKAGKHKCSVGSQAAAEQLLNLVLPKSPAGKELQKPLAPSQELKERDFHLSPPRLNGAMGVLSPLGPEKLEGLEQLFADGDTIPLWGSFDASSEQPLQASLPDLGQERGEEGNSLGLGLSLLVEEGELWASSMDEVLGLQQGPCTFSELFVEETS